jgi:hypothetical protein
MRLLIALVLAALLGVTGSARAAASAEPILLDKQDLEGRFLLQINYEEEQNGLKDFMTSRSRVVRFDRAGNVLRMLDESEASRKGEGRPVLAEIPVRGETSTSLEVDLNAGFHEIHLEEDRTGEDYYGRVERHDDRALELLDREVLCVSYRGSTIIFDQTARSGDDKHIVVHYYLGPYRPDTTFQPFEMENLRHFGFYETYPQRRDGEWVLYAMKFNAHAPIVFALSAEIPARHRDAVRDGVLYWNRALGRPLLQVIDAPSDVRAPSPDYNVIDWVTSGEYASTSYIQADPLTGQILHAHVFVLRETMMEGNLKQQNDHLRYIAAHEIGHALGLRHNFAPRAAAMATVMDYFNLTQILKIGRDIGERMRALPYDREVMRHVYLGEPLNVRALPAFCTDGQRGCAPFPSMPPPESSGIKGDSAGERRVPSE